MPSFVSHEALQAARRSAKRKRAAKACSSCKEKKAKCSGFSPCTRCINPADCVFLSNRKQIHHSIRAADDISKAPHPQTTDTFVLHSLGQWYRPFGQFPSTACAVSLVPGQAGTPWTSESNRASQSHCQSPTHSSEPVKPFLKRSGDSFQNVAPAIARSTLQPQHVGILHCGRETSSEAGISDATLGMCRNTNHGSSIGGWTCPPRAWLEGGYP